MSDNDSTSTPETENEESFFTVKDLKEILNTLPDEMEVMAMVHFPPDEDDQDNEDDEDKHLHYIPISGVEDITDNETGEKSLGLVVDVASYLDDEDDDEDAEVDDGA